MFFDSEYIQFEQTNDTVAIVNQKQALPIVVTNEEHKSVQRVAGDLQSDLKKVTGQEVKLVNQLLDEPAIILGTISNKKLIDALGLDVNELEGKWESFFIQTYQFPGHQSESVIVLGSDNRGLIYGVYDIAERMGVSPWYWWMDVPVKQHAQILIKKGKVLKGEPSIKYRGFFLNDEGPSLMSWVRTHFPDFTHEFYEKIFELTLRLKGNYHWPAMWDSTFYEDDPLNIETADLYGVVIGTSHHEPMNRPHGDWKAHKKGPWDYSKNADYLKEFWAEGIERSKSFETIINLGMRGDGDEPMGGDLSFLEKTKLMEKIIEDQREIIEDTMDCPIEKIPQMWALYKEVKEYYESGMKIPDDITLLWGDDNFGNIRRLPSKEERNRKGGFGIYYHFDYVGGPRSYKWVNTVPIQKTFEQMHKAYEYGAREVWIVNVGDLKPMEYQTEFFLRLAWDVEAFNPDNLEIYAREWAEYTFGEEYGHDVAQVIRDYVKMNGRIKPEVNNLVKQYSWENDFEAERVLGEFEETVELAERLLHELPDKLKDAFYQVAYYPAVASYNVLRLTLLVDLNKMYKEEGRTATNVLANEVKRLFEKDKQLTFEYNKRVSNGKWDHMMDQIHIGYSYWQQPEELLMPEVETISQDELIDGSWGVKILDSNKTDNFTKRPLVAEVYNKGQKPVNIQVKSKQDWLKVSFEETELFTQQRLFVEVTWEEVPHGKNINAEVMILDDGGKEQVLNFVVSNPKEQVEIGYIPIDGKISIEAEDFTSKRETKAHEWKVIPDYGRTKSSLMISPVKFEEEYSLNEAPQLSYDILLDEDSDMSIYVITAPSINYDPDSGMRLGISVDDEIPTVVDVGNLDQDGERDSPIWENSVIYNAHVFDFSKKAIQAGKHTVHLTMIDPQVIIQKVVIDLGGLNYTYLGPMPTPHSEKLSEYEGYQPVNKHDYIEIPTNVPLNKSTNKLNVYTKEAGFYQFQADGQIVKPTVNHQKVHQNANNDTVFLEQGFHEIEFGTTLSTLSIDLIETQPIVIDPLVRVEEDNSQKDILVQTILHYVGDSSAAYKLEISLNSDNKIQAKVFTKGYLKTDDQQLIPIIFDAVNLDKIDDVKIKLTVGEWEREIIFPYNKKEV